MLHLNVMFLLDQSLHEQLMEEGFSDDLLNILLPVFDSSPANDDDLFSLADPCIQCLYLLANSSDQLRLNLGNSSDFLLRLFKGLCLHEVHWKCLTLILLCVCRGGGTRLTFGN